jgi:hypothetical protein
MDPSASRQGLSLPAALVGALLAAMAGGLLLALIPYELLVRLVEESGIASVIPSAEPPLGDTARLGMMVLAATLAGLFAGAALFLLLGLRAVTLPLTLPNLPQRTVRPGGNSVRRSDAHPDAPPRPPVLATRDLGLSFDEIAPSAALPVIIEAEPQPRGPRIARATPPEQPLPADLDQPIAAFDPNALPLRPRERPPLVQPLARAAEPEAESALESPAPEPAAPDSPTDASIPALLDRLEQGLSRRAAATPQQAKRAGGALQQALGSLRELAGQR